MTSDRLNQLTILSQSVNELVELLARQVCAAYGLDPEGQYEVPGDPIQVWEEGVLRVYASTEYIPNWERFTTDVRVTLDALFSCDQLEVRRYARVWKEHFAIEQEIMKGIDDAELG